MSIFTKKKYFLGPLEFFEKENFDPHAPARRNVGIGLLNSYLTFG